MRLITIEGNLSDVRPKRLGEDWSQRFGLNCPTAVIETEVNGLPQQIRYVIYADLKGRFYCNVQRRRVYLDTMSNLLFDAEIQEGAKRR